MVFSVLNISHIVGRGCLPPGQQWCRVKVCRLEEIKMAFFLLILILYLSPTYLCVCTCSFHQIIIVKHQIMTNIMTLWLEFNHCKNWKFIAHNLCMRHILYLLSKQHINQIINNKSSISIEESVVLCVEMLWCLLTCWRSLKPVRRGLCTYQKGDIQVAAARWGKIEEKLMLQQKVAASAKACSSICLLLFLCF